MGWIKNSGLSKIKKVNNHSRSLPDKILIRQHLLNAMDQPSVLDCFAGSGKMYREVWRSANRYVGCDRQWFCDERKAFVCDNRRLLRSLDLQAFNIFDLDAYGSPWEQALIIAARRRLSAGETIAFALTDGSSLKLRMGGTPSALKEISGMSGHLDGASQMQDDILRRAIEGLCARLHAKLTLRWQAWGKTSAHVCYLGIVLQGLPA